MLEAGIAVLADRLHPIVEFELRRQQVRRVAAVFAPDADERVRLVGACAQDAARSMIFERPSDEVHAIGEQGRGERIALQSRHRLAVECEAQRPGTVDASALRRPEICRHDWATSGAAYDRKSVGEGKSVSVRVNLGGRRIIKKKK